MTPDGKIEIKADIAVILGLAAIAKASTIEDFAAGLKSVELKKQMHTTANELRSVATQLFNVPV